MNKLNDGIFKEIEHRQGKYGFRVTEINDKCLKFKTKFAKFGRRVYNIEDEFKVEKHTDDSIKLYHRNKKGNTDEYHVQGKYGGIFKYKDLSFMLNYCLRHSTKYNKDKKSLMNIYKEC